LGSDPFHIEAIKTQQAQNKLPAYSVGAPTSTPIDQSRSQTPVAIPPAIQQSAGQMNIDVVKLGRDEQYLVDTLELLMTRARDHYNNFRYPQAEETYKQFFTYFNYYSMYHPSFWERSPFFATFMEYAYTKEILGKRKEAEVFLNQQLTRLLEATNKANVPELKPIRQEIQALQAQQLLPSPAQLQKVVDAERLIQIAQRLAAVQQNDLARQFLGFAAVSYQLNLFRTERLAQQLMTEKAPTTLTKPAADLPYLTLPFGFRHTGLPYAYFPLYQDNYGKVGAPITLREAELDAETIGGVDVLGKDPNENERRRRRQRRAQEITKRRRTGTRLTRPEGDILF
jgi:hypothetical protein